MQYTLRVKGEASGVERYVLELDHFISEHLYIEKGIILLTRYAAKDLLSRTSVILRSDGA